MVREIASSRSRWTATAASKARYQAGTRGIRMHASGYGALRSRLSDHGFVDWQGWLTIGFVATAAMTAVMVAAQLTGRTRMDLPTMLGTMFVADIDRARFPGILAHLAAGQFFALFYVSGFHLLGRSGWWLGALFGLTHGVIALTVLIPLLPSVHPRMASERAGPEFALLEPPALFAQNYGRQTVLVTLLAHVIYGTILGAFVRP